MSSNNNIAVIEVYESAADIGKDLEKLIDMVGSDLVADLMPKVIRVLEQLESCVKQRENSIVELQNAQEELHQMKRVGAIASEENLRLITDVKELDAQRQQEIRDWMAMAKELEQQNRQLKAQLSEKEGIVGREKAHEQEALKVLYQLKETVDNQRDQLRAKDDELVTRGLEVDALQQHVDRLAKVTSDLRRKNELLNSMAKNLIHEKSELQSELRAMGKETIQEPSGMTVGRDVVDAGQQGQSDEKEEMEEHIPGASFVSINMEGKAIIDLSDPNRPRFTLRELQTVLQERDELKLDVMELEDELEQYRPKDDGQSAEVNQNPQRRKSSSSKTKAEPSGIKKFFSFLFRGKNTAKVSSGKEDETSWEFLEKPARSHLTEPKIDQKARSNTIGHSASSSIFEGRLIPEEVAVEDKQRRRSYTGPIYTVSHGEPDKQPDRMTCVRTDSHQLVELGQDIVSMSDSKQDYAVLATAEVDQPPISRNNSNNSTTTTTVSMGTYDVMTDRQVAGEETTNPKTVSDAPQILINNNNEEAEVEM